jgi:Leucine-rich repeat (LRR) protein
MLQELQTLELLYCACTGTSLQGLLGLSKLKKLRLELGVNGVLRSLDGIGSVVDELSLVGASTLVSLAGIKSCGSMRSLTLNTCGMSSLQPLRSLSSLETLSVDCCCIASLEGVSGTLLQSLRLYYCKSLRSLSGIEQLKALRRLVLSECGVTSLQPLSQLGEGIEYMFLDACRKVQEVVLELPHVQPTAKVIFYGRGVRELVLAGGVKVFRQSLSGH